MAAGVRRAGHPDGLWALHARLHLGHRLVKCADHAEKGGGVIVFRWSRVWRPALAGAAVAAMAVAVAGTAAAEPATTVSYPARASATGYTGLAFDTCSAPSLAAMQAWGGSPYHAIGVYVGGQN